MASAYYDINAQQYSTFNFFIEYQDENGNPVDLTGYYARLQVRPSVGSDRLYLHIDNDGIATGGVTGEFGLTGGVGGVGGATLNSGRTGGSFTGGILFAADAVSMGYVRTGSWKYSIDLIKNGNSTELVQGQFVVAPKATRVAPPPGMTITVSSNVLGNIAGIPTDLVLSFNGATGAVTGASLGANTFTGLNTFAGGISAAGATFSTIVISGATGVVGFLSNGTTASTITGLAYQPVFAVDPSTSTVYYGMSSRPVLERLASGTTQSTVLGLVCEPVIKTSQPNNYIALRGIFSTLDRGWTTDTSTHQANFLVGTAAWCRHQPTLEETASTADVASLQSLANCRSGTITRAYGAWLRIGVGDVSISKGSTVGTVYGIFNDNLTVGHISSGKPANVQNWYQIWLGQGITAGLGTIGSNRWAIYQTDPLNGNYFAGGISADRGATFGGNVSVTGFTEKTVAAGTVGNGGYSFNVSEGTVFTATLTASTLTTFTMPTPEAGKAFKVFLRQDPSGGGGTAVFSGVKWTGSAPTVTATAGRLDIFSFVSDGTNWYGSAVQGYTP